jgi:DNA-directed RNA polymerase I, II, and III subunit RPABC1
MKYSISDYYYACYNNVIDMCIDRGYTSANNTDLEDLKLNKQDFDEKYERHINGEYTALDIMPSNIVDNKGLPVYVTFIEHTREGTTFIKNILTGIYNQLKNILELSKDDYRTELLQRAHCIIIHSNETKSGSQYHPNFELFHTNKFFLNVTKHSIVPQHIMMTEKERKNIFEIKNMGLSTCPKILSDDPVNLYYNGQPGTVYKIIRESKGIYFRVVTSGKPSPFLNQFKRLIK